MNELPDHAVVDAEAALGQLVDQAAQGERLLPAPLQQPLPILTDQLLRPMPPHTVRGKAAGLSVAVYPADRCADRNIEPCRRLVA